jgi:hypothetical protein
MDRFASSVYIFFEIFFKMFLSLQLHKSFTKPNIKNLFIARQVEFHQRTSKLFCFYSFCLEHNLIIPKYFKSTFYFMKNMRSLINYR